MKSNFLSVQRLPLVAKMVFSYVVLLGLLGGALFLSFRSIQIFLKDKHKLDIDILVLFQSIDVLFLGAGLLLIVAVLVLFQWDLYRFFNRLKFTMREALFDRKLEENLGHLCEGRSFEYVAENLSSMLTLFRSFDAMKTARIFLETNSIKQLMNHVGEGVLIINQERVVTHINHMGEQMLRLIPGEIIDQAVSRKISNKIFLDNLEKALEFDKKVIGESTSIKEGASISLSIFPIKDKFGEVVRALVILKEVEAVSSQAEEKTEKPTKKE